jgi:hypothetical protein
MFENIGGRSGAAVAITRYGGERSLYFIIQKQQYSGKAINSGSYGYGQLSA